MAAALKMTTVPAMIAPDSAPPTSSEVFPEGSVDAGIYATHDEGFDHGVVVLAMGEDCWLVEAEGRHHLRVNPKILPAVLHQLACYDREIIGWPPVSPTDPARGVPRRIPLSPLLWVLAVFATCYAQETQPGFTHALLLDAERVFAHGEAWRVASALWLHGDLGHLVSNAGGGLLVFSAVVMTFGARAGWSLLAGSAIAGNVVAVLLQHGQTYRSLGASTAIFAALGLLTGRAARVLLHPGHPRRWRAALMPLSAGLAVLALFGAGDLHVDVLAHATGFGCGLLLGFALGLRSVPQHAG